MTALLEARDVTRTYGQRDDLFRALKGVSLSIETGESLAIVGKSGSGKSTLMHLLALLDEPSSGSILIRGEDASTVHGDRLNTLRNKEFGFVFQQFFLDAKGSVLDNVVLPLKIAGINRSERRRRGLEALDRLGLADKAKNAATDLSGGQKQRVVIARALVNGPSIIFADEPTGNLDTTTGREVERMLFDLQREKNITLVVVTHDHDLAARCDRSITMLDGLVVESMAVAR